MDNMIIGKRVGKRIKHYRQLERLSQEALAEAIGVSDTYIRKLEAGKRCPAVDKLMDLGSVLGVTPNQLLLPSMHLSKQDSMSVLELLNDCTPTEFAILYENMAALKKLLREHM